MGHEPRCWDCHIEVPTGLVTCIYSTGGNPEDGFGGKDGGSTRGEGGKRAGLPAAQSELLTYCQCTHSGEGEPQIREDHPFDLVGGGPASRA